MKVSIAPWNVTKETSINLKSPTKRRKRQRQSLKNGKHPKGSSSRDDTNDDDTPLSAVAARFVAAKPTTRRKSVSLQEGLIPSIVITSENNVLVLGQQQQHPPSGTTAAAADGSESRLRVVGNYRNKTNNSQESSGARQQVPVVLDHSSNLLYGLETGNTRLWCESVDGTTASRTSKLLTTKDSALDLHILSRTHRRQRRREQPSLSYGSLASGGVFLARSNNCNRSDKNLSDNSDQEDLMIQTFPSELPTGVTHVGTVAVTRLNSSTASSSDSTGSKKRKDMSRQGSDNNKKNDDSAAIVDVVQIYDNQDRFVLVKHTFTGANSVSDNVAGSNPIQRSKVIMAELRVPSSSQHSSIGSITISNASCLGISSRGTAVVVFSTTANHNKQQFYGCISLETADFVIPPIQLSQGGDAISAQCGMVAGSMLAIVRADQRLDIIDLHRGVSISKVDMPTTDTTTEASPLLVTDPNSNRIAALYTQSGDSGVLCVATTTINDSTLNRIPLCESLRFMSLQNDVLMADTTPSAVTTRVPQVMQLPAEVSKSNTKTKATLQLQERQEALDKAISSLEQARTSVFQSNGGKGPGCSFLHAFDASLGIIAGAYSKMTHNRPKRNGVIHANGTTKNGIHKKLNEEPIPEDVPLFLIVTAGDIACDILTKSSSTKVSKAEAALVLKRIIPSKRFPCQNLHGFSRILKGFATVDDFHNGSSDVGYSPMQLIVDVLRHCNDVSERTMVCMIKFALVHASANDVANILVGNNGQFTKLLDSYERTGAKDKVVANKVTVAGICFVLDSIAEYSKVNKSLLRSAIESTLSRQEIVFITEAVLPTSSNAVAGSSTAYGSFYGRYVRKLDLLSCFVDCLSAPLSEFETTVAAKLQRCIAACIAGCETLSDLGNVVERGIDQAMTRKRQKSSHATAPYQIERLVI